MAWELLREDYTDAIWSGLKKFYLIENEDGTVSFNDVTIYSQRETSFFGAKDANRIDEAVNYIMAALEHGTDLYEIFKRFADEQKDVIREYVRNICEQADTWLVPAYKAEIDRFESEQEVDFLEWFDRMKGQLSEDAAGHLQNEIDALAEQVHADVERMLAEQKEYVDGVVADVEQQLEIVKESHYVFKVTVAPEIVGYDVTVSNGTDTQTKTAESTEVDFTFSKEGTYTITDTMTSQVKTVEVLHYGVYPVKLSLATITVNLNWDGYIGQTVTCKGGDIDETKEVTDDLVVSFGVKLGNYTVTNSKNAIKFDVNVEEYGQEFNLELGECILNVEWIEDDFVGQTITLQKGITIIPYTIDETLKHTFSLESGTWSISNPFADDAVVELASGEEKTQRITSIKLVSWANGTDEEIVAMVEASEQGIIDLWDYWEVGQSRTVHLSAMEAMSPLTDTQPEQDVEFVLMNKGGKELTEGGECAFVVGMKGVLATNGKINENSVGEYWGATNRNSWCDDIFKNSIPTTILPIFKEHISKSRVWERVYTTAGYAYAYNTRLSNGYFELPSIGDVFGNEYSGDQLEYYAMETTKDKGVPYWTRDCNRQSASTNVNWGALITGGSTGPSTTTTRQTTSSGLSIHSAIGTHGKYSFKYMTDEQILEALEKHYAGEINLHDYWQVGDERPVTLSSSGWWDGGNGSLVILNKGGKTFTDGKECAFVIGIKNPSYNRSTNNWQYERVESSINELITTLPDGIEPAFKEFKNQHISGLESNITLATTNDLLTMPSATERSSATDDILRLEVEAGQKQFEFYKTYEETIPTRSGYLISAVGGNHRIYEATNNTTTNVLVNAIKSYDTQLSVYGCM